jgi:dTMP kinase
MFITFEGTEGCGKTSQIPPLAEYLRFMGYPVLATREPGGTEIGDQIRSVLFDRGESAMHQRTEILLFQAARAQHVEEFIRPNLASGKIILCDRFADSTRAYQGYGYQRDLEELEQIIQFATGGLEPDLTILLDLEVEVGLRRREQSGGWNRLDAMQLEFHQRAREGYHKLMRAEPRRWIVVDADRPMDVVQADLRQVILERLPALSGRG